MEARIGQRSLDALSAAGRISFADATLLVMSQLQSRKSRRGQSLQNHFSAVLDTRRIPYGPQCRTEGKETPDFIVPGCSQYSDPRFPSGSLRMVACKSTLKERWRQILREAERIPEKYVLTLDASLTDDGVVQMMASGLRLFLPEPVIRANFVGRKIEADLGNVANLVGCLEAAAAKS